MKKWHYLLVSGAILFGLGGCSDSDSSPGGSNRVNGKFIDAPVAGLSYTTSSGRSAVSTEVGNYEYKVGDSISFRLGNLELGGSAAASVVTPTKLGDSIKSANIAYILQNLDIDEVASNNLIQLPSVDLLKELISSDVDLYNDDEVDRLILNARNVIDNTLNIDLPVVSRMTAYNNLHYNINQISQEVSYEDLLNKTYTLITYSHLFGAEVQFDAATLKRDGIFEFSQNDLNNSVSYIHYDNGYSNVIMIDFDANLISEAVYDYYKFLDKSDDIVSICISKNSAAQDVTQRIEDCVEPNAYFVTKNRVADFIDNLNAQAILQHKSQIVNFSDIQNRYLYQIIINQVGLSNFEVVKNAILIQENGQTNTYSTTFLFNNPNTNWPNYITPIDETYRATFTYNKVTFYDNDSIVDAPKYVYKYDLSNTIIPASSLIRVLNPYLDNENINLKDELLDLLPVKSFSFMGGTLYCEVFHGCRLDKRAFDQVIEQVYNQ